MLIKSLVKTFSRIPTHFSSFFRDSTSFFFSLFHDPSLLLYCLTQHVNILMCVSKLSLKAPNSPSPSTFQAPPSQFAQSCTQTPTE
mmetsp:Transcript_11017/g.23550  ORF Transcript_11017/g.23550 Transcript_11017/m.23550 type:complete len:86 (-) Transcript_11017:1185-1442(-)